MTDIIDLGKHCQEKVRAEHEWEGRLMCLRRLLQKTYSDLHAFNDITGVVDLQNYLVEAFNSLNEVKKPK